MCSHYLKEVYVCLNRKKIILLNFEVVFILLARYKVKAVFIYLSGENMQLILDAPNTC